jgi:hypothetical protein
MFEGNDRLRGLRATASLVAMLAALVAIAASAATASAEIPSVFTGMASPAVTCTVQTGASTAGQRWCSGSPSRVATWDNTPIDVSVAFPPAPASGPDGNFPIVGIYHGWGGSKIVPSSANAQEFLSRGYAIFSMSDRGWAQTCGTPAARSGLPSWATCEHGYIHLDSQAYEERDVQYLLGQLADEGYIDPQRTAASGASYGGILSVQLAALNDRTRLPDGSLVPWVSPNKGIPMRTAAAVPQAQASDIAYALIPNGGTLDYVANASYFGPEGNLRVGVQKNQILNGFYGTTPTPTNRYYAPKGSDRSADIVNWHDLSTPPGPFDGTPQKEVIQELTSMHSAFYVNDSTAPAPMLLSNGLWDDFVPTDEAVRMYNRIRSDHPETPVSMFFGDLGHARSDDKAGDLAEMKARQLAWLNYYVKGEGSTPFQGVETYAVTCPATAADEGPYFFPSYAAMEKGEVRVAGGATQTIQATGTQFGTQLSQPTATSCTTVEAADNPATANYHSAPASGSGYTIAGGATITAKLNVIGESDQVVARLLDVSPEGQEQLVERGIYRPLLDTGSKTQVFQLHPNVFHVAAGHSLKLELLPDDYPYSIKNSTSPDSAAQHPIEVSGLELRVPTMDGAGASEGLVQSPLPRFLPSGYTLAFNVAPSAPGTPQLASGQSPNANGQFTLSWETSPQPVPSRTYALQHKSASSGWSTVASGLTATEYAFAAGNPESEGTWTYRVIESNGEGASEPSSASAAVKVDETAPNPPTASADRAPDYAGGGGWYADTVTVSFAANGDALLADGSEGSGVDPSTLSSPQTFATDGPHTASGTVADEVGNESAPGTLEVQVDASPPSLEVSCPASAPVGSSASATVTASDGQSGLASDPSGSVPIDTSKAGSQTIARTATDNVGHSTSASCTTEVVNTRVIEGRVKGKLVVKGGEAVELVSTAVVNQVEVQPGGSLDVEGARTKGIKSNGAGVMRVCGATVGSVKVQGSSGPVVLGDSEGCAGSSFTAGVTLSGNPGGVSLVGGSIKGSVKVTGNSGGVTVTGNTIGRNLTVSGNSGAVVDSPNAVGGKSKVQARRR